MANVANIKWCENLKNDRNPDKWVLICEYSARAFQWIPTWQGFNGFQKAFRPCALDKSNLSIGRVKCKWVNWHQIIVAVNQSGHVFFHIYLTWSQGLSDINRYWMDHKNA